MPARTSLLLLIALFFQAVCLFAQHPPVQPRYALVRVHFAPDHTVRDLAALGMECDHGNYQPGRFLENVFSDDELAQIRDAGFECEVLVDDMAAHYLAHCDDPVPAVEDRSLVCDGLFTPKTWKTPANYTAGSMGGYPTWDELLAVLDDMKVKFPNLISVKKPVSINAITAEGRTIYWLRISDNPEQDEAEPKALYTALHHAREPQGLSQTLFFMWYLLENYASDPEIKALVDNSELLFIPCLNPDGYVYNQTTNPSGGGFWRKNRSGGTGVDLNRNYGHGWGFDNNGSSADPTSTTYRGPAAFSEPETQAAKQFCEDHDISVALNAHSSGNLLIYPFGYNNQPSPDHALFQHVSALMVSENSFKNGLAIETVGYAANGTSDDWMYVATPEKGLMVAMTPEIGPSFWPNPGLIDRLNKSMMWTNLTAARILHHYGIAKPEPVLPTGLSGEVAYTLTRYGLLDGSLTVSLAPLSANIASVGSPQLFSLAPLASAPGKIGFTLAPGTPPGAELLFLLKVTNGTIAQSDTLRGTYRGSIPVPAFVTILDEPVDGTSNWTAAGGWATSTQEFVSPPFSFTDTPTGNYPTNRDAQLTTKDPINLATATAAQLTFFARWNIEKGHDYAEVLASANGTTFVPLCGKYTRPGTANQDPGQPVYDGKQLIWVDEEMDLGDYLGGNLWLRFRMVSDGLQSADGFYFDDLEVKISTQTISAPELDAADLKLEVAPNPASVRVAVRITAPDNRKGSGAVLTVCDALGKTVARRAVSAVGSEVFQTEAWHSGLYIARLEMPNGQVLVQRFLVAR
ncbi:MAG: M14 family zinc carboxypeptidase [Saprospiraceae bacterium]